MTEQIVRTPIPFTLLAGSLPASSEKTLRVGCHRTNFILLPVLFFWLDSEKLPGLTPCVNY